MERHAIELLIGLWAGAVLVELVLIEGRLRNIIDRLGQPILTLSAERQGKAGPKWPQPPKPIAPPPPRKRGA